MPKTTTEGPAQDRLTTHIGAATADDGTAIGWLSVGQGPGLVVVHGAMQSGRSQRELAELLADRFTVHLVDRRGRGRSGPYPDPSDETSRTDREAGDLTTVLAATGATAVLGISSGAIITLRTALTNSPITKMAIFEPPLSVDGSIRLELIERFHRESAAGDTAGAMVSGMLAAEMGPALFRRLPRPLLRAMTARMIKRDDARDLPPDTPHLRQLAAALGIDLEIVAENADRLTDYADIGVPTLLLSGTKSPRYLQRAVSTLADTIPGAERVELAGTNHGVTQNSDEFGAPDRIVGALVDFFARPSKN